MKIIMKYYFSADPNESEESTDEVAPDVSI